MKEIRRLSEENSDHYIDFLEKNGLSFKGDKAAMILPNDTKSPNIVGDSDGLPRIYPNQISLLNLLSNNEGK